MIKTKIKFEDIKAGDLLEVVLKEFGVKSVLTGIAYEKETMETGVSRDTIWWSTSEGGMIVNTDEESAIYRIDVTPVEFEDIRKGDKISVTTETENGFALVATGVAENHYKDVMGGESWRTADDQILIVNRWRDAKIEILERADDE